VRRLVIVGSKLRADVDEGTHPDVFEVASHEVPTLCCHLFSRRAINPGSM